MPFSKIREPSPERRRDSSKRDSTKPEKAERKERHRSHRKSSSKDKQARPSSRASVESSEAKRRLSMPGAIDAEIKPSPAFASESKSSLPYPSFSKAHSKESVGPGRPQLSVITPPPTDIDVSKSKNFPPKKATVRDAPPSPPLTDRNAGRGSNSNSSGKPADVETILEEDFKETPQNRAKVTLRPKPSTSSTRLRSTSEVSPQLSPIKPRAHDRPSTPLKARLDTSNKLPQRSVSQPTGTASPSATATASEIITGASSDATSIAPEQPRVQRPGSKMPGVVPSHRARSEAAPISEQQMSRQHTPLEDFVEHDPPLTTGTPAQNYPPPPPPPPFVPVSVPKVDYLLQNGGLHQTVTKNMLLAGKPMAIQQAATDPQQPGTVISHLFEPYNQLLRDYEKVMSKNGSLAVATGYRSVARRLLDRLEAVFSRDISSEACQCCMCQINNQELEDIRGVSWGEVLELVSGRSDLPNWPPFSFVASPIGLGISLEAHVPMQKLDIDVPEEYREHYIRQSRKTKQSVDRWLNRQTDSPSSPPEEVDDETLTFAILTHLEKEHRPTLKKLLGIVDMPIEPPRRVATPDRDGAPKPAPTPQPRVRPQPILTASLAIERLYRLGSPPRDPETAIFLLNNPGLHNALATLAAISSDEWDILISGRFDGFLRSGAEDVPASNGRYTPYRSALGSMHTIPNVQSRKASYASRTGTPATGCADHIQPAPSAQYGAPIALDEEMEIATLAEIERDIYLSMEQLEDAFEALHLKAETIRESLRVRSAGLAAAQQRRRAPGCGGIEVRLGTPGSEIAGGNMRWEMETDDGLDWEGISEVGPDDSASNISSSRRRRPKRREARRTPALIEEDEDGEFAESEGTASPVKRS